jgi:hypothetical protein
LEKVKKNGFAIEFIANPSEAVKMAAVKQNGWAIICISNPSQALRQAAGKQLYCKASNKNSVMLGFTPEKSVS